MKEWRYNMRDWMTISDLSEYLQIPENRIRFFIKHKKIPFYDGHGFLRFDKKEIDDWMKSPNEEVVLDSNNTEYQVIYRGKPIKKFTLTASMVLVGETPWNRLPEFIKKTVVKVKEIKRDYLYHEEFIPFLNNYNDYLRISCQLGLIENRKEFERKKHYYPTDYSHKIYLEENTEKIKRLIRDSILNIVRKNIETEPDEKHSILLLWYFLKIKEKGLEPEEHHFKISKDKPNNHYPSIRLGFSESLCDFLFSNDRETEQKFLKEWDKHIT